MEIVTTMKRMQDASMTGFNRTIGSVSNTMAENINENGFGVFNSGAVSTLTFV